MDINSQPVKHKIYTSIENNSYLYAFSLVIFFTLIRLWFIGTVQLNLSPDEAQYWDWSRRLQLSYYSKGPLIAWDIGFWTSLLGDNEFAVRFGAVFNSVISQLIIIFGVGKILKRPVLAVLCLFVANTMPLFSASAILMTTDSPLLICWLSAFFSLYLASKSESKSALIVLFLAMAFGNLAKYMMFAFFGLAIPYLIILYFNKLIEWRKAAKIIAVMIGGCVLGLLPIVIWNAMNGWVGFLHVGTLAGVTGAKAQTFVTLKYMPEFVGSQLGIAMPWWFILAFITGIRYVKNLWNKNTSSEINMQNIDRDDIIRQQAIMSTAFLLIIIAFFIWSFHTRIYANWPAMSYVGAILLAASGLERFLLGIAPKFFQQKPTTSILVTASIGILIYLVVSLPIPPKMDPTLRLKGWTDLSQELERLQSTFENPEEVFYFSSKYDTTAALAFYAPNQPRSFDANFDNRLSQYDLWENPSNAPTNMKGWDALYISTKTNMPESYFIDNLGKYFEAIEIIRYQSKFKYTDGREFIILKCYNYNGTWVNRIADSY